MPKCLFNKTTETEPLFTTYRDVNNQQIEFIGTNENNNGNK